MAKQALHGNKVVLVLQSTQSIQSGLTDGSHKQSMLEAMRDLLALVYHLQVVCRMSMPAELCGAWHCAVMQVMGRLGTELVN